ncbi:hypothetical protein HYH03_008467 [Edaphochlamys debaryana]|uniref:Uncharacterized protein n=1 Tax=Edaphochlamys debaryana TaxID=47281 RepID=A0A836BYV7_9CHLO|nr:hypothetical protein HYH03_008467 [Edaphochlamys debaryana]|eukprot:KAG2493332.1 hypothetical protein HYH03_008467 [Edaphochlamys debaryana]
MLLATQRVTAGCCARGAGSQRQAGPLAARQSPRPQAPSRTPRNLTPPDTGRAWGRRAVAASAAAPSADAGAQQGPPGAVAVIEWDVVEYELPAGERREGATLGLGKVEKVEEGRVTVWPLEEEAEEEWVESHDARLQELPPSAIRRVLDFDLSQRQDRESNPHGEHAHDVYRLLNPPSQGVYRGPRSFPIVVRS